MSKLPSHDVKDLSLAAKGKSKIQWAGQQMPVLQLIKARFLKEKTLKGITIGACLHVTSETANLMLALQSGGAKLALCASNPLSTQDEVAAALVADYGIATFARRGEDNKTYYKHLQSVMAFRPNITMDDGGDLINLLHKLRIKIPASAKATAGKYDLRFKIANNKGEEWEFYGSSEETTTGVIRLKAMEKEAALKVPVLAVNDSDTKHLFDNRYGTGQSTIDGILRATNILLAGKVFVVAGYGWCSRGIAMRAKGMGAKVIVAEVNPVRALEAAMDGFRVMPMAQAAEIGDIFVTATGDKNVINMSHIKAMKDGAILANSGHFNVEIDVSGLEKIALSKRKIRENLVEYRIRNKATLRTSQYHIGYGAQLKLAESTEKKIYLLAEGRLVNLAAAEGHPAEVMDMSFANQALSAEYFVKNKGRLKNKVYVLPEKLDRQVAELKLKAMGIAIDKLTKEQRKYLSSWKEGT